MNQSHEIYKTVNLELCSIMNQIIKATFSQSVGKTPCATLNTQLVYPTVFIKDGTRQKQKPHV